MDGTNAVQPTKEHKMSTIENIMSNPENAAILQEFFIGIASCDYYDGMSHQLYLDQDDNSLRIHTESSDNSWLQRDDGSLAQVERVNGYCDTPEDERYTDECDLNDYGYAEWLDMIGEKITAATESAQS